MNFILNKHPSGYVVVEKPHILSDNRYGFPFIGIADNIIQYLLSHRTLFTNFINVKEKMVCLIGIEAEKNPQSVGLPADVLVLNKKRHKWYFNRYCADALPTE
ncbi:hypothetical protein [Longitalea arenae]|uniref:hypothetical protein n=1 Tax=Longitalea arenae TaxID=2812558 RepID=UPI001967EE5A|nr:hypothetical protein [Longitalea arenae]